MEVCQGDNEGGRWAFSYMNGTATYQMPTMCQALCTLDSSHAMPHFPPVTALCEAGILVLNLQLGKLRLTEIMLFTHRFLGDWRASL